MIAELLEWAVLAMAGELEYFNRRRPEPEQIADVWREDDRDYITITLEDGRRFGVKISEIPAIADGGPLA